MKKKKILGEKQEEENKIECVIVMAQDMQRVGER